MASDVNIQMKQFNGIDYDNLYPKTKAELTTLNDETKIIMQLSQESSVNEALLKLYLGVGKYGYAIKVFYPDNTPLEGMKITGLLAPDGSELFTDNTGLAIGVSTSNIATINLISPFIDVSDIENIKINSTGLLTSYSTKVTYKESPLLFTSSQTVKISQKATKADFCTVGGGGGGSQCPKQSLTYDSGAGSAGGGGGYANNLLNYLLEDITLCKLVIGAGGIGAQYNDETIQSKGGTGGSTSIEIDNKIILSSPGGTGGETIDSRTSPKPGIGNGNGGAGHGPSGEKFYDGVAGESSTVYLFNEINLGLAGGGGGGSGVRDSFNPSLRKNGIGGLPNGGDGGYVGKSPGGGGGGGSMLSPTPSNRGSGLNGGSGGVYIRVYHS